MTRIVYLLCIALTVFTLTSCKNDLGPVEISAETDGHWKTAGEYGIICEHHKYPENVFFIQVYRKSDTGAYERLMKYQIKPESCDVFTSDLQAIWEDLGTIVEDTDFTPEYGDVQDTLRRWKIQ